MSAPTIERTDVDLDEDVTEEEQTNNSNGKVRHYFRLAQLAEAATTGLPQMALCGRVQTVTTRGYGLPTCDECKYIYDTCLTD